MWSFAWRNLLTRPVRTVLALVGLSIPILGVLGLFTRIPVPEQGPAWLRIFADYIAVAFVNARAFEENDRLRARLDQHNRSVHPLQRSQARPTDARLPPQAPDGAPAS